MSIRKRLFIVLIIVVIAAVLVLVTASIYEEQARKSDLDKFPPTGELISVGDYRLHLDCRGTVRDSLPIIILEAGLDPLGSLTWSKVHDSLAEITRTCAYDRAGVAWSDPGLRPRSGDQISEELKLLLSEAGEDGPYLFVAHSMGGPHSIIFLDKYPNDVVGLVLVESTHPDQFNRMPSDLIPTPPPKFILDLMPFLRSIGAIRLFMKDQLNYNDLLTGEQQEVLEKVSSGSLATVLSEFSVINETLKRTSQVSTLEDLPLVVLSIGAAPDASKIKDVDQDRADEIFKIWLQMQVELSELSSNNKFIPVSDASHYLQFDQPHILVNAVRQMLKDNF